MGLLDRVSDSIRGALVAPGDSPSLADRVGVRALSDEALRHELERRRRARGRPAHGRNAADDELTATAAARRDRLRDRTLAKCFSALELSPGATRQEVQRAYRSQLRQYHPDRNLDDAERHASAVALATNLTDAYLSLLAHLNRR
jgi:hypothetical protein